MTSHFKRSSGLDRKARSISVAAPLIVVWVGSGTTWVREKHFPKGLLPFHSLLFQDCHLTCILFTLTLRAISASMFVAPLANQYTRGINVL